MVRNDYLQPVVVFDKLLSGQPMNVESETKRLNKAICPLSDDICPNFLLCGKYISRLEICKSS